MGSHQHVNPKRLETLLANRGRASSQIIKVLRRRESKQENPEEVPKVKEETQESAVFWKAREEK